MDGELRAAVGAGRGNAKPWTEAQPPGAVCDGCGRALLRPDIVFFGEMPYEMEAIDQALRRADLFVSVGTSGAVYPAAGFVQTARHVGARTLELNLEPRSEEHTAELQSLMLHSYAVFCLKQNTRRITTHRHPRAPECARPLR